MFSVFSVRMLYSEEEVSGGLRRKSSVRWSLRVKNGLSREVAALGAVFAIKIRN